MFAEQQINTQGITLEEALEIIQEDNRRFPNNFGPNYSNATKLEMYNRLFSIEARCGSTEIVSGKEKYIPGYYERYPSLSKDQIDSILTDHIIDLANAEILTFLPTFLERDLTEAASNAIQSTKI